MAQQTVSWDEFKVLQQKYVSLQQQHANLQQEFADSNAVKKHDHSGAFWREVIFKMLKDPDYIKGLVRSGVLSMFDTDVTGKTLLMNAAFRGSYEIAQFCLNQGADINQRSRIRKTALDYCRGSGYFHIEQLLLFASMNVNIGNEIKKVSSTIRKQQGVNKNMFTVLNLIGEQSKTLFEKTLMELMITTMQQRLAFDDNLLSLCWSIAGRNINALDSELWKAITSTCEDIVKSGNKRDWHWLKSYIIPSTIWYQKEKGTNNYVYYKLLQLVDIEAMRQLDALENDLNVLSNGNKKDWNKLTVYRIPQQYEKVRQDLIPNGIVSGYTYNQLSESSGALFNSPRFYDYNQYLSQLILLAQIVDDDFQASVQDMFQIDKVTNFGNVYEDEGNNDDHETKEDKLRGDGTILYQRGPVKLIERARHKAQTDYAAEEYPASACVVDFNRCSLIFNDITTMLTTLQLFVNKVKYYQSGSIIGIIRAKNGFIEYVKETQYADIKLNVLIKGKHNNVIGEVQFLLNRMKAYKDKAHNLYAIQRQKESIETSVSKMLPLLLDADRHLFIAGNHGNVRELCEIMVTSNKTTHNLLKKDANSANTILTSICKLGHVKAFDFLQSVFKKEDFIGYALAINTLGVTPLNYAVQKGHVQIVQRLFDIQEIRKLFAGDNNAKSRLCMDLFGWNIDWDLTDYVLKAVNMSPNDVKKMIHHKYKRQIRADVYSKFPLVSRIVVQSSAKGLEKLVSIIGEQTFCDGVFMRDLWGNNAVVNAVVKNKDDAMRFMLELDCIRKKCMQDKDVLFSICAKLEAKFNKSMAVFVMQQLKVTEAQLRSLQQAQGGTFMQLFSII